MMFYEKRKGEFTKVTRNVKVDKPILRCDGSK